MADERKAPPTKEVEVRNHLYGPFTVWDADNKPHTLQRGEVKKVTLTEKMAGVLEKAGHVGGKAERPEPRPQARVSIPTDDSEKRKR